ncbi:MAG: ketoacyl-ACP synthase III [Planctomycetes bacterium]|nr:ketoacyl-ACP synthase III [Planctomycetota bacterium]
MPERHVRIAATGRYLPGQVLTNEELVARFGLDVDAAWIEARTGIRSRHWMQPGETTSDMAAAAARAVLDEAGVEARELDRIVLATISPDQPSPATAMRVARLLGARCPAFDVSAACAGFLYGLDLGAASVRGGEERVLVLAADARSRFVDPTDRRAVVLFADGAAGALLVPSDEPGLHPVALGAEGRERPGAEVPAGGAREPASHATVDARRHFVQVDGRREIFDLFVAFTREACDAALAAAGLTLDEIDLFITHQGNALMVQEVLDALGLPPERAVNDVVHHGNTSSATVPIALAEARAAGRIRAGDRVLLTSVGAGYTFGAVVHRF